MERRKFMLALGATSAAGAAALGTGAFSSVEANRLAEVEVVNDEDAYLSIQSTDEPNGEYAEERGDTLVIAMDDGNNEVDGTGVNPEALTVARNVFEIQNQGTQPINVDFEGPAGDPVVFPEENLYVFLLPEEASLPFPLELDNGESQKMSVVAAHFDDLEIPTNDPDSNYTITAEAV